jgi:hypothetical protein
MHPRRRAALAVALAALTAAALALPPAASAGKPDVTRVVYDDFSGGQSGYEAKWSNPYGPGELAAGGSASFSGGAFRADAVPFRTGADFSVFDHIKYLAVSNAAFEVPPNGSVTFSLDITAQTPGTERHHDVHGTYVQSGAPYAAKVLEGQQAGATLHMVDFTTGQLFDWFVSGSTAFTLVERLPASVIGSPQGGTRETMYTQIVDEVPIRPGAKQTVAIRYTRTANDSYAEWLLNGKVVSKVESVGVPLDVQGVEYTGIYPSLGAGELLRDQVDSVVIGHGLFSLLDAFPFQHPDAPELSVSIPMSERLFGQGARATYDNMVVTTEVR